MTLSQSHSTTLPLAIGPILSTFPLLLEKTPGKDFSTPNDGEDLTDNETIGISPA